MDNCCIPITTLILKNIITVTEDSDEGNFLLLEDGTPVLDENGDPILLEN